MFAHQSELKENESTTGLMAQDVQRVLPQAVCSFPSSSIPSRFLFNTDSTQDESYLRVDYEAIVPVLVEALKEQQQVIQSLVSQQQI
jgi:hypothetical protein